MNNVLIFAGTTEGRSLGEFLSRQKVNTHVCVATEYGETLIEENAYLKVHAGRLDAEEIGNLIQELQADCVVDATGNLVGIVSEVGYNWCTVLTVVDTSTSMGAQVFRTKDLGVAVGDFSLMGDGRLRMDYLPADCQLLGGDLVVTSGLGGYYPSGLVIGSVEEVQKDDSGASSYAVLVPEADLDSLTEVAVIKSFDIVS